MTVIVGIDGSAPSQAALAWAIHSATNSQSALRLVHVVDDDWGQMGSEYSRDEASAGALALADAVRFAQERMPAGSVSEALAHGSPAWELAASAQPGDLLVVGTHKTGHISGRVLGTRSIVVASVANCSVAVIPDTEIRSRLGVVVGVAQGDRWHDAVSAGALMADKLGHTLSLIHARAIPDDSERVLLADAAAHAISLAPTITVRSRLSRRPPAQALLDASRAAALLVLGHSRRDPRSAGFVGSVTHEVLLNLNSPVLIARSTPTA